MSQSYVIAIASGKGGTGKTTIAVNLAAYCARSNSKVQYLDCDVEEPNGHIFLKPKINIKKDVTVQIPQVDSEKCIGCGKCGKICRFSAIVHIKDNKVLTFEQLCHSCGGCIRVCPTDAIRPKKLKIGDIEIGQSDNLDFVQGKLNIGNIRTPSLIKEVKTQIKKDYLSIIDVPPGTSCSVVEAVKGTDFVILVTEPTPFGLNDLKLAVGLVKKMKLPFAVAINRDGIGNDQVEKYCRTENIDIALKLPDDRAIARAYSTGQLILDQHEKSFSNLFKFVKNIRSKRYAKR